MGCWTVIKSFHVKIILLDKKELIQEIQVCVARRHIVLSLGHQPHYNFAHNPVIAISLVFALADDNSCFARLINENQI